MKIAIIGYGKMGHMIEDVALQRGHEITCVIDRYPIESSQSDYKTATAARPASVPARGTIISSIRCYTPEEGFESEAFKSADVAIEFTTPATAQENILRAWAQGVPVICGTTGWKPEVLTDESVELREVDSKKLIVEKKTGKTLLVWSSNYSVGVNIFFDINKALASAMASQPQYKPSIVETHHIHKLDKPSGTAVAIANQIAKVHTAPLNEQATDGSALPKNIKFSGTPIIINGIPIESIREGEVPGTHEVTWDSEEDTIIITHIAKGRRGFALGAVLAAEEVTR